MLLLPLLLLPTLAQAQACPAPTHQPVVNLIVTQEPVRYDNTHNIIQLRDLMTRDRSVWATGHGHVPLGLAQVHTTFKSSLEAMVTRLPGSATCAHLRSVNVEFRFSDSTIFVANDLPRDSCIYREVLAHEHKHVNVDTQLINEWRWRLQQEVERAVMNVGTVRANSADDAVAQLGARLEPHLKASADAMLAERSRRQALVDTPEEYRRVSHSCNGEVRKYVPEGMLR